VRRLNSPADHAITALTPFVGACREVCIFTRFVRDPTFLDGLPVCAQVHLLEFRDLYAQQSCRGESPVWRAVVRLNLVRSVNKILDALGKVDRIPDMDKLRKRLSPLHRAQRDLEKHLGLTEGEEMRAAAIHQLVKQGQQRNFYQQSPLEKAVKVLTSSRDDITVLWGDDNVRAVLETHGTHLDEHSKLYVSLYAIDRYLRLSSFPLQFLGQRPSHYGERLQTI